MTLRIREYREELQLSQSELAKRISNVQRNVSNWENGISARLRNHFKACGNF